MKVFIGEKKLSGGPSVFRKRLVNALLNKGYQVFSDPEENCDVEIGFISFLGKNVKKKILRLDGVYYQQHQISMNDSIKKSIQISDAVICQSDFSKKMIENMVCKLPSRCEIIGNGVDYEMIKGANSNKRYSNNQFIMCADWRNTKRPKSAIRGFNRWVKMYGISDAKLVILGDFSDYIRRFSSNEMKNCIVKGNVNNNIIYDYYKSSDFMLHLCFIDSFPNAVVEGVACGLPVLCTNLGGTSEIVKNYGIVMHCDSFSYKSIPKINDDLDPEMVAIGINKLFKLKKNPSYIERLDINTIVDKYINFLESVV